MRRVIGQRMYNVSEQWTKIGSVSSIIGNGKVIIRQCVTLPSGKCMGNTKKGRERAFRFRRV